MATKNPLDINRDPNDLYPYFHDLIIPAVELCQKQGMAIYIFEGYRTYQRSDWLYAQGRTRPGNIVTNARGGFSAHNFGFAVDLVFDGDSRDGIQWSWDGDYHHTKYSQVAKTVLGAAKGIEWAGNWVHFKETPHFQLTVPYQWHQLDALYDAGGLKKVWAELDSHFKPIKVVVPADVPVAPVEPPKPVEPEQPAQPVEPAPAPQKKSFWEWLKGLFS